MRTLSKLACRLILPMGMALCALSAASLAAEKQPKNPWQRCAQAVTSAEANANLPPFLLSAISKIESGRWHNPTKDRKAWPWTVRALGEGHYFEDKATALTFVQRLQARGVRNIDVGCLQVNLHYHPQAFASLEEALDPTENAAYAAALLTRLRQESNSWTAAIGRYHSRTPTLSGPYRLKVFRAWREERKAANRLRRQEAKVQ